MRTVWQALAGRGFLWSVWPWRAVLYLGSGAPAGAVVLVLLLAGVVGGGLLAVVLVGIPLLVLTALAGIPVAVAERYRLRIVDQEPVPGPHRVPDRPGLRGWLTTRLRERATWRELAYTLLFALVLWPLDAFVLAVGLGGPLAMLGTPALMGDGEVKVLKLWTVTTWPSAAGVALLGLVLLAPGLYALGAVAGARAELTRLLLAPEEGELGRRVVELAR
ncbi:sensor domain-containing protein, partial [Streptomyces sp. W16]|uniref:sensor domain-containing protein n=1 Tax=Streptomyces sp. W16 TaxID=3076631 RepID=UPI003FA36DA9